MYSLWYFHKIWINWELYILPPYLAFVRHDHDWSISEISCRTSVSWASFFPNTLAAWNQLPQCRTNCQTHASLKATLHKILHYMPPCLASDHSLHFYSWQCSRTFETSCHCFFLSLTIPFKLLFLLGVCTLIYAVIRHIYTCVFPFCCNAILALQNEWMNK